MSRQIWIRWSMVIALATMVIPGIQALGSQKKKSHAGRKTTVRRKVRHSRRYHHYHRFTRVTMQPERVTQIQAALADAGFFHESPNGKWDTATRDAMRQYQKENGFTPTGLPEAKPLMMLGLGPHPLPPGLGPRPASEGQSQSDAEATTASTSPAPKKPIASNQ